MDFKITSPFQPKGDQVKAIQELKDGLKNNFNHQVLLGATGTGKTFTIANVINDLKRPAVIVSHNKTLAAQLYSEMKTLFPENRVEYFVSNFDYYRPEAYVPSSDTYIDKTSKSNWDLEAMRMSSLNALSTRRDAIIVASVASIYGQLNPLEYQKSFFPIEVGMEISRKDFFAKLVQRNYNRNNIDLSPGTFRAKGDVIEIAPGWTSEFYIRIDMFGDEIEEIAKINTLTGEVLSRHRDFTIYPANAYTTGKDTIDRAVLLIEKELEEQLKILKANNKLLEAQRLEQRTRSDIDSLKEFGVCTGIENYSRHLNGKEEGQRPFTIFDYLPSDALIIIDESHVMIPQLHAMYNADHSRKKTLVEYGFRLPSALDNRPLKFEEFEKDLDFQKIYVSATPSDYEIDMANGTVVNQIVRPTGLLDPVIEIYPTKNQIEHIFDSIQDQKKRKERTFILTTTKRMAEELSRYLLERGEKVAYIHSEHKTFERSEILRKLRKGVYDTVVGVNLIREGIDVPEISLILILDADKESFFRSTKSLIQIIGRAARNVNGRVYFYGDKMTKSMQEAINETQRRRLIQEKYNQENNITPKTIVKPIPEPLQGEYMDRTLKSVHDPKFTKDKEARKKLVNQVRGKMLKAAKDLDFEKAAQLRDMLLEIDSLE